MSIVVGYLEPTEGRVALQRAIEQARLRALPLHIVGHVPYPQNRDARHYQHAIDARTRELERVAARVRDQHGLQCAAHVPFGAVKPADAIDEVARESAAQLVVIGLRRRSPVGKVVLGSNAQDVLLTVDAPVLAVKADDAPAVG